MRLRTLIAAISGLGLLLPALLFAQGGQQQGQQPQAGGKGASQAQGSQQAIRAVKASTLIDMPVINQEGEMTGEVHDVMIDPSEGRVAYVILDLDGWFDIGGNLVAAPMDAFNLSSGEDALAGPTWAERARIAKDIHSTTFV